MQAVEDDLIVTPPPRDSKPPPAVTPFAKHQLAAHKRYEAAVANGKTSKKDKKAGHVYTNYICLYNIEFYKCIYIYILYRYDTNILNICIYIYVLCLLSLGPWITAANHL